MTAPGGVTNVTERPAASRYALVGGRSPAGLNRPGSPTGSDHRVEQEDQMERPWTLIPDLAPYQTTPEDGTLSRTIFRDGQVKAVLFSFDAGQELSEHTAAMPAFIQIVQGQARLTLGDETVDVGAGAWIHMPAGLRHAVAARTPLVLLLLLMKGRPAADGGG
jgi:quercetin dioxygenase-like cupin family protein